MSRTLRSAMTEHGWPEDRIDRLVSIARESHSTVLHVDANVVAIRVRGAPQRTYRELSTSCIKAAREATNHLTAHETVTR